MSGRWLVKALLGTLFVAAIALYCTVCLLFYQGQWQFVFFPAAEASHSRKSGGGARKANEAAVLTGLPAVEEKFDYTEEGAARLDGWWIPAGTPPGAEDPLASLVVLYFPDGRTGLRGSLGALRALHEMGVSVFAFDYRGVGASQPGHPSQQKTYEDGVASFDYLRGTRHIDPRRIVLYGAGVGSAVAVHTAAKATTQLAGIVLENPQLSLMQQVKREQHIHMLPMRLIFTDRFDIHRALPSLKLPKLVISTPAEPEYRGGAAAVYAMASAPKQKIELPSGEVYANPQWRQAVIAFLRSAAMQSR